MQLFWHKIKQLIVIVAILMVSAIIFSPSNLTTSAEIEYTNVATSTELTNAINASTEASRGYIKIVGNITIDDVQEITVVYADILIDKDASLTVSVKTTFHFGMKSKFAMSKGSLLANNGSFIIDDGNMEAVLDGTINNSPNARLSLVSYKSLEIRGYLINAGLLTIPQDSTVTIAKGSEIISSGEIINKGNIKNHGKFSNTGKLTNDGSIENFGDYSSEGEVIGGKYIESNNFRIFDEFAKVLIIVLFGVCVLMIVYGEIVYRMDRRYIKVSSDEFVYNNDPNAVYKGSDDENEKLAGMLDSKKAPPESTVVEDMPQLDEPKPKLPPTNFRNNLSSTPILKEILPSPSRTSEVEIPNQEHFRESVIPKTIDNYEEVPDSLPPIVPKEIPPEHTAARVEPEVTPIVRPKSLPPKPKKARQPRKSPAQKIDSPVAQADIVAPPPAPKIVTKQFPRNVTSRPTRQKAPKKVPVITRARDTTVRMINGKVVKPIYVIDNDGGPKIKLTK